MSLRIIVCPECRSSFYLNGPAMDSIDGLVRCGACLAVFRASEHFLESEAQSEFFKNGSVFMSDEPIDYFNPIDFMKFEDFNGSDGTYGKESKIKK